MNLDTVLSHVGDIGRLELEDIIDTAALQLMMNDFFKLTKIGIAIIDMSGKLLVTTGWQDICTQFHRIHPETCKNCIESDRQLSEGLEPGAFKIYKCKNNMWDIATPIMVGEKHMGNLFLGQFLFEDEAPDYEFFRSQARQFGFNEEEYLKALDRVPRWSRETVYTVMAFYSKFAQMVSMILPPFLRYPSH
jgi:ligand-binding sensor protein